MAAVPSSWENDPILELLPRPVRSRRDSTRYMGLDRPLRLDGSGDNVPSKFSLKFKPELADITEELAAYKLGCQDSCNTTIDLIIKQFSDYKHFHEDLKQSADVAITKAEAFSQKLEDELEQLNESVSELKSSLADMLSKVDSIIKRLTMFKDLEDLYVRFDANYMDDPLKLYEDYIHMSKIVQELEAEPLFANAQRALDFKLTYCHKGVINKLIEKYGEIFSFKKQIFDDTQFYFNVDFNKMVSLQSALVAMEKFEVLDVEVKKTAEAIMNSFVEPLLRCKEPLKALRFERIETKIENVYQIGLDRNVPVDDCDPFVFLETLEIFFKKLITAFAGLSIEEKPITAIFGLQITPLLFDFIVEKIIMPAVPQEREKHYFEHVFDVAKKVQANISSLCSIDGQDSRFLVDSRCAHILQKAVILAEEVDLEMVTVGNDVDYKVHISTFISDFAKKVDLNRPGFATPGIDGFQLRKSLKLQRCKIPKNVFELAKLFTDTIDAAVETEDIEAARKLMVTAFNMMKIYDSFSQRYDTSKTDSVPLFYNGFLYLNHVMMMKSMSLKQKALGEKLQCDTNFFELIFEFRKRASQALENHLLQLRRQISSFFGSEDPFINLANDDDRHHASDLVDSAMEVVEHVAKDWRNIIEAVHARAIASLVSHLFTILSNIVLSKKDIREVDAHEMVRLFEALITRCEKLLTYIDQPHIQNLCEEPYYRFKEITLCLSQPLMNFADRWCDGIGPLANWLKIDQVKNLIRALFARSELRSQLLARMTKKQSKRLKN